MIEIAIDGTAASGKGTLAKKLSLKYNFPHLDTGLLYRMVAVELIDNKKNNSSNLELEACKTAKKINFQLLENNQLRSEETANLASKIASFPDLRKVLDSKQIEFAKVNKKKYGGCILDGRDIGTKILPDANFKFFINASIKRDTSDSKRKVSPLVPAEDAYIIDTSSIDADELLSIVTNIIEGCSKEAD